MRGGKRIGDRRRLAARERADRIDEPATGLERAGDMVEHRELGGGKFAHVVGRSRPARVRVALPGADAAARGIEEDAVELLLRRELGAAIPEIRAVVEKFRARGAALKR